MDKGCTADFLKDLFNTIADKDPMHVGTKAGSRYIKEYWRYNQIRICVTKEKLSHELISITLTKL